MNLFDYCCDNLETLNKTIFFIGNTFENSQFLIAIDNESKKIYSFSNEWLYLIKKFYYPSHSIYSTIIS